MKTISRAFALAVLSLLGATAALAASPPRVMQHAILRVAAPYKHNMRFAHVMASATLRHAKMDIYINVTTDNLPAPMLLHKRYYVVWAANGAKREALGTLKIHGNMAGLKSRTMMRVVQDIVISAENSSAPSKSTGPIVLSGMVG